LKLIDANSTLSIQVHPNDSQALVQQANGVGKAEAYYVLAAEPGARLYYGLRPELDRAGLAEAIADGELEQHLIWCIPEPGDVLYTAPGTIHALGAGLAVYEIQQNSNITYRLYDWGRLGLDGRLRPLHLTEALAVTRFPQPIAAPNSNCIVPDLVGQRAIRAAGPHFALEELRTPGASRLDGETFHLLTSFGGPSELDFARHGRYTLDSAMTLIVPASMGDYAYRPPSDGRLLRAYVPDLAQDIVKPARSAGYTDHAIGRLGETL
jgi:mannose-6-phosphate isomerase